MTWILLALAAALFAAAVHARRRYLEGIEPLRPLPDGSWYVQCSECGADTAVGRDWTMAVCRGCSRTIYPKDNLKEF